jgi:P27 family predicted phage terminase small subunit
MKSSITAEIIRITDRSRKKVTSSQAPPHLEPGTRKFYSLIMRSYVLEPHHEKLLRLLCEAYDRSQQARRILDKEGLVVSHEKLGPRPHPAISIERDSAARVARLTRELNLSVAPSDVNPPKLKYPR